MTPMFGTTSPARSRADSKDSLWNFPNKKAETRKHLGFFLEKLAATYSRGVYKTTTIGKTAFDGRVRNGIGSDHSFMATKK